MKQMAMDLIREHCEIYLGKNLSPDQLEVLLTVFSTGDSISLSHMSDLLRLPRNTVAGAIEDLSRLRVRRDNRNEGPLDLIRMEGLESRETSAEVFLTEEGKRFTLGLLQLIVGDRPY